MISIIVAVSDDWGIGRNNDLLWNIPDDLRRFKKITFGKTVIMGKRTWESLPKKPLPGRKNIVITDVPGERIENATMAYSIEESIRLCENDDEAFVIGGGSIYRQFLPAADKLYITHVHSKAQADVYFPTVDMTAWKIKSREDFAGSENHPPYSNIEYLRR